MLHLVLAWTLVAPLSASGPEPVRIHLLRARFDPLVAAPDFSESVLPHPGRLHLVQFHGTPSDAARAEAAALGAELLQYVPDDAYVVRAPSRAALASLSSVRWVGPFHPEYRLAPEVLAGLEEGTLGPADYHVLLFEGGPGTKRVVAQHVAAGGGAVDLLPRAGRLLRIHAGPALLASVAALDEVAWIDPAGEPGADLALARQFSGANYLQNETGFNGQGVRGEVFDTGLDTAHPAFQHTGGVLIHGGNSGPPSHGTAVTGAVFSDGTGNPAATGMCPSGKIVFGSFFDVADRPAHTAELVDPNLPYRCVFQTNSWGSSHSTLYTSITAQMDDMAFDNDLLLLNSMGNQGSPLARPEGWAKNVIGVGGVSSMGTVTPSDDAWTGATTGPAADGRIKPDLAHFYDGSLTTGPGGGFGIVGGTSISTGITAGYLGLFFQMWHNDVFDNGPTGADVFESRPHFTLAKAAMINTAFRWPFTGSTHNLARTRQGWGAVDVADLYDSRAATFFVDQTDELDPSEVASYGIDVQPGAPELRATLVWPEPAGFPGATKALLNDLHLKLTAPGGTVYWGNNGLLIGNESAPGGAPNDVDSVENVFVRAPANGTWLVEVIASSLTTDIVPGSAGTNAVFSLWVTGGTEVCTSSNPDVYCTAGSSASGCQAQISSAGIASASAASGFVLTVDGVEGSKDGQFFFGANGRQAVPWGNGTSFRCVVPPISRGGLQSGSGANGTCDGTASQDLNALWCTTCPKPAKNPGPGATVQAQYWYRDPQSTSNQTTSFSNAIEFDVCP